jgi:putative NADH-flavin reductase
MKLTIFGATGGTGQHLVEQALARGHQVTAFTRSASKLRAHDENLAVVQGDATDPKLVSAAVEGAQAVISVLGPSQNQPVFTVRRATEHILSAMREHGVQRLILSAGAGVEVPGDEPNVIHRVIKLILKLASRWVYEDMKATVELVRRSELAWTIVRVPRLTGGEPVGRVRAGYLGDDLGTRLTRADMARFMLDVSESGDYRKQAPVISS